MSVFDELFGTPKAQGDGAITVTELNEYIKAKLTVTSFFQTLP